MNPVYKELAMAVIRHAMTSAGPAVVANGLATEQDWAALVSQAPVLVSMGISAVGLVWSFFRKWRRS